MARNAHPEVTERRILDAAQGLFFTKGYENTSIQDIVDQLGDLSKGAIYHHFKSKKAILDRLTEDDWQAANAKYADIAARTDINGLAKLRLMIQEAIGNEQHNKLNQVSISFLDDPQTLAASLRFWATELPKRWQPFIEEGVRDGSIPTAYPREAAELISLLSNYWLLTHFYPATKSELRHRVTCLATMLTAIGVPVFNDELIDLTVSFYMSYNA